MSGVIGGRQDHQRPVGGTQAREELELLVGRCERISHPVNQQRRYANRAGIGGVELVLVPPIDADRVGGKSLPNVAVDHGLWGGARCHKVGSRQRTCRALAEWFSWHLDDRERRIEIATKSI